MIYSHEGVLWSCRLFCALCIHLQLLHPKVQCFLCVLRSCSSKCFLACSAAPLSTRKLRRLAWDNDMIPDGYEQKKNMLWDSKGTHRELSDVIAIFTSEPYIWRNFWRNINLKYIPKPKFDVRNSSCWKCTYYVFLFVVTFWCQTVQESIQETSTCLGAYSTRALANRPRLFPNKPWSPWIW